MRHLESLLMGLHPVGLYLISFQPDGLFNQEVFGLTGEKWEEFF